MDVHAAHILSRFCAPERGFRCTPIADDGCPGLAWERARRLLVVAHGDAAAHAAEPCSRGGPGATQLARPADPTACSLVLLGFVQPVFQFSRHASMLGARLQLQSAARSGSGPVEFSAMRTQAGNGPEVQRRQSRLAAYGYAREELRSPRSA